MNQQIQTWIKEYVKDYKTAKGTASDWREPVIGFADANNPEFRALKDIVGMSHALPQDLLADAKSVIVFFLPFEESIIASNIGDIESSRAWDIANIETNHLILDINHLIHEKLRALRYDSTIMPATYNYDEKLLRSDWSHRHVALIAGVGTFGINNMLITDQGCCGRMGSIITNVSLEPSVLPELDYCLYKYNGSCGKCIDYCVVDAIKVENNTVRVDRYKCNDQIYNECVPEYPIGIGDACGKCMCGLPCSSKNPLSGKLPRR